MKKHILLTLASLMISAIASAKPLYYQEQLELDAAHAITTGAANVTIAILDSGLNYRLDEFQGRVAKDPVSGSMGLDVVSGNNDPLDALGHGTEAASLIAGLSLGVAPNARVIPIKVLSENGGGSIQNVIAGLDYAVARQAKIILLGLGIGKESPAFCEALYRASAAGILIVASAGNDAKEIGSNDKPFFCTPDNLILVAATNENKKLAIYSNYSFKNVHMAAPGHELTAMDHTGAYTQTSGTSRAAALASGVAALVMSAHPEYTAAQTKEALIRGANRAEGIAGKVMSNGILSALKAITVELE